MVTIVAIVRGWDRIRIRVGREGMVTVVGIVGNRNGHRERSATINDGIVGHINNSDININNNT
jgi:hypothetical protein